MLRVVLFLQVLTLSLLIGAGIYFYNYNNCHNKVEDDEILTSDIHIDSAANINTSTERSGNQTHTTVIPIPLNTNNQDIGNRVQSVINSIMNTSNITGTTPQNNINVDSVNSSISNRLSIRSLNQNTEVFITDNPMDKCSICNETYEDNNICRKNNICGHTFHQSCIDTWFGEHSHCPICNQSLE